MSSTNLRFYQTSLQQYSYIRAFPALQSIIIGIEILQAYTAVLAYAKVSLLTLIYKPM